MKDVGRKFFYIRMLHGYTQEYVARKVGISATSYVSLESGRVKNVPLRRVEEILALYGLTAEHFFSFTADDLLKLVKGEHKTMDEKNFREMINRMEGIHQLLFQMVDKLSAGRVGNRTGKA